MNAIITMPAVTTSLAYMTEWASPIFNDFWPIAMWVVGISLAFGIIAWLTEGFFGMFKRN